MQVPTFFSVVASGPYSFCSRAFALLFCADYMVRYNGTFSVQYGLEFLINFKAQMDCSVFGVHCSEYDKWICF